MDPSIVLNGICPYFTMFPLEFPFAILNRYARPEQTVLDPFCGRGTTNFASRLLEHYSVGVDASPVATAIANAKLVHVNFSDIVEEARSILSRFDDCQVPRGEFWRLAFHTDVLQSLCQLRTAFLHDCSTPERIALRGIILGALHGPKQKTVSSYFSNQCPRTYAPKPQYAVRYWKTRNLIADKVDVLEIIKQRARRFYHVLPQAIGEIRLGDSRSAKTLEPIEKNMRYDWIITSPPYFGMKTYVPDQWLRNWFVGGSATVDYEGNSQLAHKDASGYISDLRVVWRNVAAVSSQNAKMVVRFGGMALSKLDPIMVIKDSLKSSGWRIMTIKHAGNASDGRRQATTFLRECSKPIADYDVWATRC